MGFTLQPKYKIGDKVLVLFQTIDGNPGYFVNECEVEETVRGHPCPDIYYRLRLPDNSVSVVSEVNCRGDINSLKEAMISFINRRDVEHKRILEALEEYQEEIK